MNFERFPYPYNQIGRVLYNRWADITNPVGISDIVGIYQRAADVMLTPQDIQYIQELAHKELESAVLYPQKLLPAHAIMLHGFAQEALRRVDTEPSTVNEYLFNLIGEQAPLLIPSVMMEDRMRGSYFRFTIKMCDVENQFFTVFNPTYIDPEQMTYFREMY